MSLVGPRPIIPEQLSALDSESDERFDVRPGVTGLAQVSGRRALSWPQQLAHDVDYARRVSFALDLKIILWTVAIVVTGSGVYGSPKDNWRQYIKKSGSVDGGYVENLKQAWSFSS
jgi:lipopolysaccharide/colanic/teichoic acid biosynthesis glycosyltransferase